MKILYLTPGCFDKGGISRYNRYQIQALRELEGEENVRVISLAGPSKDDFEVPFEVFWHGSGPHLISKAWFLLIILLQNIFWRPHLILIGHVNFSGIAVIIARLRKATTLLNTYGLEVWSGLKMLPQWGLRSCDYVLSDCYFTANYLEDSGFRPENSVWVIWDCVDLTRFYPLIYHDSLVLRKYGIPDPLHYPLIVTLGRISKTASHKGYDRLIRAFSRIHFEHPESRLVLAGKGDLVPELKVLVNELGLNDKVIFAGMIAEEHLVDIYRSAYVFSLVSDRGKGRGEGIPLTPLEAMACGVPIIVGNQDGSQEAVENEDSGFVIDPMDLDEHARKLKLLLEDHKLRDQKAGAALERVARFFSFPEFMSKHRDLLTSISENKHEHA